ncbi:MAG: ATP-binding protein, partial [Actinomycetota bacterium]|nr:ATP-binding protein [Actinomycetota bacterium]
VTVAQARSEVIQVRPRWDDLQASVQVALAAAGRHRAGHRLTVSVEPLSCELDHERFQQVLRNLVENAYKYSPPDSRVVVLARRDNHRLELRVADDGPGIPAAERERVFEPFRRLRGTRVHGDGAGDSSGLGLYVVQQIVAAMGGSLELHTSSGGTEFVVSLPAQVSAPLKAVPDRSRSRGYAHNEGPGAAGSSAADAAHH